MYKIIETERLILKPSNVDDAAFFLELYHTPKWIEFIGDRNIKTEEEAANHIKNKMLPQFERLGFSNNTVILKETGEKIGSCGLYEREGLDGLDIGFAFLPQFEKKGYGFESASKLLEMAFNEYGYKKISAYTTPQNIDSQNLILKLGLKYIKNTFIPNDPEELMLFEKEK